ncbi:unnamed protein product [Discula destructiva]
MGLGSKIKNVLSSEHHQDNNTTSSSTAPVATTSKPTPSTPANYRTPGTFPTDDVSQRHTNGKEHMPPHDAALTNAKWKETDPSVGATRDEAVSSTGAQHNRLSNNPGGYDSSAYTESKLEPGHRAHSPGVNAHHTQPATAENRASENAYWGALSQSGQGAGSQELSDRTRLADEPTGSTGQHHGAAIGHGGRHHDQRLSSDQAVGGGTYNATPAQHSPTGDSRFDGQHLADPPVAGIHSSDINSRSPNHSGSRIGQPTGGAHNAVPSDGSHYNYDDAGVRGHGQSASQHDGTGHRHGLAGAGAAAGVAAGAGYGAHEYGQNQHTETGHAGSGSKASDGVPRTSMLDPEPAFDNNSNTFATRGQNSAHSSHVRTDLPHAGAGFNANSPTSRYSGTTGFNDPEGTHGPHASRIANTMDPRVDSDRDHHGSRVAGSPLTSTGHAAGGIPSDINNSSSNSNPGFEPSAQNASSGSDRKHFGPGHEGAKVLHSCEHCGRDNDISRYFSKDVVYRLGQ